MKKTILSCVTMLFVFCLCSIYAQTSTEETIQNTTPQIQLPDITTVIEREQLAIDPQAIPSVNPPIQTESTMRLPELPAVIIPPEAYVIADDNQALALKDTGLYISGMIGGGYPGVFTGAFSLYQMSGKPDFNLNFFHDSVMGYGTHPASRAYLDTTSALVGIADFTFSDTLAMSVSGEYTSKATGMQSKSVLYFNSSIQNVALDTSAFWDLPLNLQLYGGFEIRSDEQILGFTQTANQNEYKGFSTAQLNPEIGLTWKYQAFSANLEGNYYNVHFLNTHDDILHRGELLFSAGFSPLAAFSAEVSGGVVFSGGDIIVPFALQAVLDISDRIFAGLSGGLRSVPFNPARAFASEPFLQLSPFYREQSDWFVAFEAQVPLVEQLTASLFVDFEKTAFGNGHIVSVYEAYGTEANDLSGLFSATVWDRTALHTRAGVSYGVSVFVGSISWDARWFDVAKNQHAQQILFELAADSKNEKGVLTQEWGALASCAIAMDGDFMPKLDIGGFYSIFTGFRLSVQLTDIISAFSKTDRIRAAPYIGRGMTGVIALEIIF